MSVLMSNITNMARLCTATGLVAWWRAQMQPVPALLLLFTWLARLARSALSNVVYWATSELSCIIVALLAAQSQS